MLVLFVAALTAAPQDAPAPPPAKPEKKVCRAATATGSIMPKRTCHTRAEWQAIDDASRAHTDGVQGASRSIQTQQAMTGGR